MPSLWDSVNALNRSRHCVPLRSNGVVHPLRAESTDADPANWRVTQQMLERETAKVKKAKSKHSGKKAGSKRRIGFCVM